jgi:hypothetical protein
MLDKDDCSQNFFMAGLLGFWPAVHLQNRIFISLEVAAACYFVLASFGAKENSGELGCTCGRERTIFSRPLRSLFERRAKGEGLEKRAED